MQLGIKAGHVVLRIKQLFNFPSSTATRYGLDGRGIQISVASEIFRTRPGRPLCPPSPLHNGYQVSFPGVKRPRRGIDHPAPTIAEVQQRVKLQAYL